MVEVELVLATEGGVLNVPYELALFSLQLFGTPDATARHRLRGVYITGNKGHTGVGLVPMSVYLSSPILSPDFYLSLLSTCLS